MKIIKFSMSKGDPILLPFDKAEKVIDSELQIIKITDEKGEWTGQILNKSFLVSTDIDRDATRTANQQIGREQKKLELPSPDERGTPAMKEILEKNRPTYLIKEN